MSQSNKKHSVTAEPFKVDGTPFEDQSVEAANQNFVGDLTYQIGSLAAANRPPTSFVPDTGIHAVITHMALNNYSQVPIMNNTHRLRDVKGVISWRSIGSRFALKGPCDLARDCMEDPHVVSLDESIFSAIKMIDAYDYVLVQKQDKQICGIVTASDFNEQLQMLAKPFLSIGEIESGTRQILVKFTIQELEKAKAPGDDKRIIEKPGDLTFGEYIRLLENKNNWKKLKSKVDRAVFVEQMRRVRDIRNNVMHFRHKSITIDDLNFLCEVIRFTKWLRDNEAI